jgi:CheY-like chemotaxis protein
MPVPARILLVDDDADQCESLYDLLDALGCMVRACTTAQQGLRASRGAKFDLVLVHLRLPGMDPLEFVRRVRRHGHRWIVLVVADDDPQRTESALQVGADGVIEKPIPVDRLREWIAAAEGPEAPPGILRSFCLCER